MLSSFVFKYLGINSATQIRYTVVTETNLLLLPKNHGLDRYIEEYANNDVFCKYELISRIKIFRNLSCDYLFMLARFAHYQRFKVGDTIQRKSKKPNSIFIVKQGIVSVGSVSPKSPSIFRMNSKPEKPETKRVLKGEIANLDVLWRVLEERIPERAHLVADSVVTVVYEIEEGILRTILDMDLKTLENNHCTLIN